MNSWGGAGAAAMQGGYSSCRAPFTAAQWQELEQQALIYNYIMAGLPVPHHLLLPIKTTFMPSRFLHHHYSATAKGYCTSLYGKKLDPEPGRCRRTDGKKWRCSKDAYPDSKYCERHMQRGRNRSRKPVETSTQQMIVVTTQPSSSSSSTCSTTHSTTATSTTFQNLPIHTAAAAAAAAAAGSSSSHSQLHMGIGSYGIGTTSVDYRYPYGAKTEVDEYSFFSEASGSVRGLCNLDSALDSSWRLMPSQISSFPISKESCESLVQSNYSHYQNMDQVTISSLPKPQQQQQYSFFGGDFGSSKPVKNEGQSLHPFFDEWPKSRDSWSDIEDDRSNRTSFSTTQLSISIPMASSDFSTNRSHSPNDD